MLPFPNYYISTPIMSHKKNIFRSHKNRRKMRWPPTLFIGGETHGGCREEGRGGKEEEEDELATVKAAAWAWYQRNEGKPMMMLREFDLTISRASRTPRPSRYKLEANKNMILSHNTDHLYPVHQETKCSSLLDPYEINSISKRIDEGSNLAATQGDTFEHHHAHHKKLEYDESKKENGFVKKVSMMRNLWKGFILITPRTVCGRSDDVDHRAYRSGPRTVTLVNIRNNNL